MIRIHQKLLHGHTIPIICDEHISRIYDQSPAPPRRYATRHLNLLSSGGMNVKDPHIPSQGIEERGDHSFVCGYFLSPSVIFSDRFVVEDFFGTEFSSSKPMPAFLRIVTDVVVDDSALFIQVHTSDKRHNGILDIQTLPGIEFRHGRQTHWSILDEMCQILRSRPSEPPPSPPKSRSRHQNTENVHRA
ncbi:hypothetical protein ACHAXS_003287 [Conticribra weissflogii]